MAQGRKFVTAVTNDLAKLELEVYRLTSRGGRERCLSREIWTAPGRWVPYPPGSGPAQRGLFPAALWMLMCGISPHLQVDMPGYHHALSLNIPRTLPRAWDMLNALWSHYGQVEVHLDMRGYERWVFGHPRPARGKTTYP